MTFSSAVRFFWIPSIISIRRPSNLSFNFGNRKVLLELCRGNKEGDSACSPPPPPLFWPGYLYVVLRAGALSCRRRLTECFKSGFTNLIPTKKCCSTFWCHSLLTAHISGTNFLQILHFESKDGRARGNALCWGTNATSRKVALSIPDAIRFFSWLNLSSRTMALGSTQSLTEMNNQESS
jgi:hypothetical protein